MQFKVILDIGDADVKSFFDAIKKERPALDDQEADDAYLARVTLDILNDIAKSSINQETQKEALKNIVYPDVTSTKG